MSHQRLSSRWLVLASLCLGGLNSCVDGEPQGEVAEEKASGVGTTSTPASVVPTWMPSPLALRGAEQAARQYARITLEVDPELLDSLEVEFQPYVDKAGRRGVRVAFFNREHFPKIAGVPTPYLLGGFPDHFRVYILESGAIVGDYASPY